MKIKATVNRIAYAQEEISIEIPDAKIPKTKRGKINQRKLKELVESKAIDEAAGSIVFDEHDADYELEGFEVVEKFDEGIEDEDEEA